MKRTYFRRMIDVVIALLMLSLIFPAIGLTQNTVQFSSLEVDIWPEYDRPGVLVIYHITLSPDTTLPVDLSISIPTEVGEPNAVAVRDANGGLFNITYTREINGEWSKIRFTPTMPEIQLEYYDNRLEVEDNNRHYEYFWSGDYAIGALTLEVQQPVGASNLHITPAMGDGTAQQDGLIYYTSQAGSLKSGQTFEVTLDYQKETEGLSAESLQLKPSAPVSTITPATRNLMAVLPWILGTLGAVLILGGGVWWYWQSGMGKSRPKLVRHRRRLVITQEQSLPEGYEYCHHCGKRAVPGDKFCRSCGTRLRTP